MGTSYVKMFNDLVEQFLIELMEIFPENNSIKLKHSMFNTFIKVNVKKPCIDFMTQIIPYLEMITLKDYDMFIGPDAPDIISKLNLDKQILINLSDNNKAVLWRYVKSFITIGSNIIEMPEETHKIINYIITN